MKTIPSGTVTFLFSDIEGSTGLWEREPERMRALLLTVILLGTAAALMRADEKRRKTEEALRQGFVGQRCPHNRGQNLVHVRKALHGIGESLLVDSGVLGPDAVADGAVGGGGEC